MRLPNSAFLLLCMWRLLSVTTGLVLMNSAGLIVKGYKPEPDTPQASAPQSAQPVTASATGPPAIVADVLTTALLFYLEKTISRCSKSNTDIDSPAQLW